MNKRGQLNKTDSKLLFWIFGTIVAFIVIMMIASTPFMQGQIDKISKTSVGDSGGSIAFSEAITTSDSMRSVMKVFDYIIGGVPNFLISTTSKTSAAIIVVAIWLLLFITFGDIIANFSTFGREVSWVSAFLIAIIAANLGWVINITVVCIGIFAGLGAIAVVLGLGAAFLAFLVVNGWFIGSLGPWVLRRRLFMQAEKNAFKTIAGAREVEGAITGLKGVGKALRDKS